LTAIIVGQFRHRHPERRDDVRIELLGPGVKVKF